MSILFGRRRSLPMPTAAELIPSRPSASRAGTAVVTNETAMRHSAVWACLRLRADLVSTMPIDVYRRVNGIQVEVPKPPVIRAPGGERLGVLEWMYSTQVDLDRAGNAIGIVTARDGLGFPARIDLAPIGECVVKVRKGELYKYVIAGQEYEPRDIWHERQYTLPGLHMGLSPIAHAAWSIGEYLSIQEFALDWFGNGAVPAAQLRNKSKTLTDVQSATVKERFKAAVANRDIFVTGADWEYQMIQAEQAGSAWVEAKNFGVGDIARFFGCPGDLIDAAVSTGSITYANITQRNLQFLIMNLGPAIIRREHALSRLMPTPRYVKLNTDALLRMDPASRAAMIQTQINARVLAPSEARELDNRPPLTETQMAEFDRLFGSRSQPPAQPAPAAPAAPTTGASTS